MSGFADRDAATMRVIEELKRLYKTKIKPLEQLYHYDVFNSPCISDAEFDSKPQVMLVGQYSVGKTTFIRYLLGRDFPSMRIGPEPTTDRFTALIDGPGEKTIYGNSLAVMADMPYRGLERFGLAFLNRFEGIILPSPVLRNITLIDTRFTHAPIMAIRTFAFVSQAFVFYPCPFQHCVFNTNLLLCCE